MGDDIYDLSYSTSCDSSQEKLRDSKCYPSIYRSTSNPESIVSSNVRPNFKLETKTFCEPTGGGKICHKVQLQKTYKIDEPIKCVPKQKEPSWAKYCRSGVCHDTKPVIKEKIFTKLNPWTPEIKASISEEEFVRKTHFKYSAGSLSMTDTYHNVSENLGDFQKSAFKWNAEKRQENGRYENGDFSKPYFYPPNEVNFIGGLGEIKGHPRSKRYIDRQTTVQKLYNMRTRNNALYSFTENPREANCIVKKKLKIDTQDVNLIKTCVKDVRLAENIDTPPPSETSENPTEIYDHENPLCLDLQGIDYKENYRKDEQEIQNRREYYIQKRCVEKRLLYATTADEVKEENRARKYGLPDYFNLDIIVPGEDGDSVTKIVPDESGLNWRENFKAPPAPEDPTTLGPMPEVIPDVSSHTENARLIRTTDKIRNIEQIEMEHKRRKETIHILANDKIARDEAEAERLEEERKNHEKHLVFNLGRQDFENYFKDEYAEIRKQYETLPPVYTEKKYPHTLRETRFYKRKMNREKRVIKDQADLRQEFNEIIGKPKHIKETELEPDPLSDSDAVALTEQSSDDEDGNSVGHRGNGLYQLRGFHYRHDTEPKGKNDVKHKSKADRPLRTCITRKQWFEELCPKEGRKVFFKYNPSSIPSKASPNDDDYILFKPEPIAIKPVEISPIHEMISNPTPEPQIIDPVRPKVKKPKYLKVKKFNLTGYLFGTVMVDKTKHKAVKTKTNKYGVQYEIIERSDQNFEKARIAMKQWRDKRRRLLGIPIIKYDEKKEDESSDTDSDVDWVPPRETYVHLRRPKQTLSNNRLRGGGCHPLNKLASNFELNRSNTIMCLPATRYSVTNMRAPEFREPTLKRHPRRKRFPSEYKIIHPDLSEKKSESLPHLCEYDKPTEDLSETSKMKHRLKVGLYAPEEVETPDKNLKDHRAPYDVPRMSSMEETKIEPHNCNQVKRTEYTKLFSGRHHHDHATSHQHKVVYVKYQPQLPQFKLPTVKKAVSYKVQPFDRAYPRGTNILEWDRDRSLPIFSIDENQEEIKAIEDELKTNLEEELEEVEEVHEYICPTVDGKPIKIREENEKLEGKERYTNLVDQRSEQIKKDLGEVDENIRQWNIDEDEYMKELQEVQASVASCRSSVTSSVCTNFTNDSGSYMSIEGVKIPCDYITKSQVPFEEINRIRVKTTDLEYIDEYYGPYYIVPFSGQRVDMMNLCKGNDRFFTNQTRNRYGIRNRLKVDFVKFSDELIGTKNHKYISQLATEWDEYYQHEIKHRPFIRKFKHKTIMNLARDSFRKKFEIYFMKLHVTEQKISKEKEVQFAEEVQQFKAICEPLFSKWEETHYRRSMRKLQDLKPFYEITDSLRKELIDARKYAVKLNMDIVYTEDDWIRSTILQNFHYLISEMKWRDQHDWIHRNPDGTMENFRESIEKRPYTNIRNRDRDDAWAVKEFYENHYLQLNHPIIYVFPDAKAFKDGIAALKMRSFMCLLELHYAMWLLANTSHAYNSFIKWSDNYISKRTKYVRGRCTKQYFIEDRASALEEEGHRLLEKTLYDSVAEKHYRITSTLCEQLFLVFVPQNVREDMKEDATIIDKFSLVCNVVTTLLGKMDHIPLHIIKSVEATIRRKRAIELKKSKKACALEQRINNVMMCLKKNLEPPYQKPKRVGKLPRYYLEKKVKVKVVEPIKISEAQKLFYRAFTNIEPTEMEFQKPEDLELLKSIEDNCIPFYFDHFLKLHDYIPNYDFKTNIELREGDEYQYFTYKDVIFNVKKYIAAWESNKQYEMEQNIQKTWYLYKDTD